MKPAMCSKGQIGRGALATARRAVLAAVSGAVMAIACGPSEPTVLVYPEETVATRAILEVAYLRPQTIPEMAILRPDERAAITSDPERGWLYVGSRDGTLRVLDAEDGSPLWEYACDGPIGSMPLLLPGEPVLLVGTDNGALIALDLELREPRWTYETQGTVREPPVVDGDVIYFANSRDQIFAIDARSGAWRWQYEQPFQTDFTIHGRAGLTLVPDDTPEVPEGGLLVTGFGNGRIVALSATSGDALWQANIAPPEGGAFVDADGTPLVDRATGEVVVTGQATGVFGLSLADGAQRWSRPLRGAGSVVNTGDGGLVVASSLEGIYVIERGGRLRWRRQQDPGVLSTPVVIGAAIVVGHSERGLLAFDRVSGEVLATLDVGSGISGQPVYDPIFGRLYAMSNRGLLITLRVASSAAEPVALSVGERRSSG